jgi:hypothetical protein
LELFERAAASSGDLRILRMASEAPTSADGAAAAKAADVPPVWLHSGAELLAACRNSEADEAIKFCSSSKR